MAITRRIDPRVRVASGYTAQKRTTRNPAFPFMLQTKPFQLQPIMTAPVLPGETLSNLVTMSRVVTKPIKQALVGWWCEYYFFYVRLRDIEYWFQNNGGTAFLDEMVTDPANYTVPTALISSTAQTKFYNAAGGLRWTEIATKLVTEYYFRDEGEQWDEATLDGLPLVQIGSRNWMDSLTKDSAVRDRSLSLDLDADGQVEAQEMLQGMEQWQALRDAGLESLDYEDWIRTFGVSIPERDEGPKLHKPELVRYWRQWQYPTNTVEPTTGVPSSAVSWVNAFRADKDRFFKEPGFIVGFTVQKPKLYLADPAGALHGFMSTLENWLPALSHKDYERGFKKFAPTAGPLAGKVASPAEGYWVDLRDLLIYGDQFLNFVPDAASNALSTLAADGVGARYPKATHIDNLFAGADKYIQQDGVVNLSIKGRQIDRTPGRTI